MDTLTVNGIQLNKEAVASMKLHLFKAAFGSRISDIETVYKQCGGLIKEKVKSSNKEE